MVLTRPHAIRAFKKPLLHWPHYETAYLLFTASWAVIYQKNKFYLRLSSRHHFSIAAGIAPSTRIFADSHYLSYKLPPLSPGRVMYRPPVYHYIFKYSNAFIDKVNRKKYFRLLTLPIEALLRFQS